MGTLGVTWLCRRSRNPRFLPHIVSHLFARSPAPGTANLPQGASLQNAVVAQATCHTVVPDGL